MKQTMSEDKQFIFESIYMQVRSGFYNLEEIQENILEEVEENGFGDEISEEWTHNHIHQLHEDLINESKSWEFPTETERLIAAFDELSSVHKITALHFAGYTTEEGEYEVTEIERTLIENEEESAGYCFYHGQDLERAVQGDGLLIAFQKVDNTNDSITKEIAKKIVSVLQKHDLKTSWDGKATSRIELPDFKWSRIYNENNRDLLNYNYVIDAILGNQ